MSSSNGNGRPYTWHEAAPEQIQLVARLVREARLARDMTPGEAAVQAGVSRGAWYRWEAGRMSSTTARVLWWLLHDPSQSHDAFYWRERALAAEAALAKVQRAVQEHTEDRIEGGKV